MDKTGSVKIFVQLQTCLLVKIMPSYLIITISGPATVYREEEEEEGSRGRRGRRRGQVEKRPAAGRAPQITRLFLISEHEDCPTDKLRLVIIEADRTSTYLVSIELSFLTESWRHVLGLDLLLGQVVLVLVEEMLVLNLLIKHYHLKNLKSSEQSPVISTVGRMTWLDLTKDLGPMSNCDWGGGAM